MEQNLEKPEEIMERMQEMLLSTLRKSSSDGIPEEVVRALENRSLRSKRIHEKDYISPVLIAASSSTEESAKTDEKDNANPSVADQGKAIENDASTKADNNDNNGNDAHADGTNEKSGTHGQGNNANVIQSSDDENDLFKELDGKRLVCGKCYPTRTFHMKNLYIIHCKRHYSRKYYVCTICQQEFVKLMQCVHHELTVHKKVTDLKEKFFASAVSRIMEPNIPDGQNNSHSSRGEVYDQHIVPSSSLCCYTGPSVESYNEAREIGDKHKRPRERQRLWPKPEKSRTHTKCELVNSKEELATAEMGSCSEQTSDSSLSTEECRTSSSSNENGSESSKIGRASPQKRKKFRKTRKMKKQKIF